jgi:hypothetical protein
LPKPAYEKLVLRYQMLTVLLSPHLAIMYVSGNSFDLMLKIFMISLVCHIHEKKNSFMQKLKSGAKGFENSYFG